MILLYIHDMIYERPEPEFAVVRGIKTAGIRKTSIISQR